MTTIAYKNGIICADTRVISNGFIAHEQASKIVEATHPIYGNMFFGISGDFVEGTEAIFAILNKQKYEPSDKDIWFTIIGITKLGKIILWCKGETHTDGETVEQDFYAIGSGSTAAKAAMLAGCSAQEAVVIASQLDPSTGTKNKTWDIKELS